MAMNTQLGYDPANYYVWRTPDGFSIHLSLNVVRDLSAHITATGETCGILLGRAITTPFTATIADDFAVIAPSDDFESARHAAENDGRQLRAIGYFRSQGDTNLKLGPRDLQTFDRWFYENGSIGLFVRVLRRGDSEAALFYWEDGQPKPREFGFGFPFDAKKLAGGHPGWRFPDPLESAEAAPPRPALRQAPQTSVVTPTAAIRWSRLWPTAALIVIGLTVTQALWNSRATTSASAPSKASASQAALGLRANSEPHQLQIYWNRAAPAITSAITGTMSISEDGVTEAIPFEAHDLREGYVAYSPRTNDVNIRFEVTAADGTATSESIRVVAIP
jgi:hypothetical protein